MDYVLGSVAALISGNVTPNRPKVLKRALTPMKHQPSPNVTPKSESGADRSIFLSPTMQKKKAIVKKSPKRIFENPDMDATSENEDALSMPSPIADKVKKHLKDELESDIAINRTVLSPKSPKNKTHKSVASPFKKKSDIPNDGKILDEIQVSNECTSKRKKKKLSLTSELGGDDKLYKKSCNNNQDTSSSNMEVEISVKKSSPKKKRKFNVFTIETIDSRETEITQSVKESSLEDINKSNRKIKYMNNKDNDLEVDNTTSVNKENKSLVKKGNNKINKKKIPPTNVENQTETNDNVNVAHPLNEEEIAYINPNAITNQDTDSEHESDDDIQSENEENNKTVFDTGPNESSDDEEKINKKGKKSNTEDNRENVREVVDREEEVKRTLFVGNVPFSSKCKKEIKRIFDKYGEIETVRIRTVPVKDGRVTPKLAVIKNELHPDRSTVNVYIKYSHPASVNDALAENNTVLNDHHLRVARSDVTGSEHDPRCSVFVGNMPFALEDDALRAKFANCGEIESVRIIRDRKTNAGKGFGYVNFASKDGVELALALTEEDLTLKNRILRVKRCTQPTTNKLGRQQNNQAREQNNQRRQQNYQGREQNNQRIQQNNQGRQQNDRGRWQDNQGRQFNNRRQDNQGRQFNNRRQDNQGRQFNNRKVGNDREAQVKRFGRNQFGNDRFQRIEQIAGSRNEGAYRRIMEKRKPQESSEGPPQKRPRDLNQPIREKKPRKEFIGTTADKKKFQKRKPNKDQKKKKALSEILTKQRQ